MADLPSSFTKVNDVEVAQDAPVTESLNVKFGSNLNYLKDERDSIVSVNTAQTSKINEVIAKTNQLDVTLKLRERYILALPSSVDSNWNFNVFKDPDAGGGPKTWVRYGVFTAGVPANGNSFIDLVFNDTNWDVVMVHTIRTTGSGEQAYIDFFTYNLVTDVTTL